jgi:hypothetical protein
MVDGEIPECRDCRSTEVVVHKRDVAARRDQPQKRVGRNTAVAMGLVPDRHSSDRQACR